MVERTSAIKGHALNATAFPIDIFDTAFAFDELCVIADFARFFGKEQRALETLGTIARGMIELKSRMHEQAFGASWSSVSLTDNGSFAVLIEWDCSNASMANGALIGIPRVIGCISRNMSRELIESDNSLLVEGTKIRDIAFIEGEGVFGKNNGSIVNDRGDSDPSAIAPEKFFFELGRAVFLFLIGTAFDAQAAIRITGESSRFVVAVLDVGTLVIFLDGSP
jgi:hypothetical protein